MPGIPLLAAVLLLAWPGVVPARVTPSIYDDEVVPPRVREARPPVAPGRPGQLVVVPGQQGSTSAGALRFLVEVEGGLAVDRAAFARHVTRTLRDRRSWTTPFRRVSSGPVDFRVTLASPALTNRLCAPLLTNGIYSCGQNGRAVLNAMRWRDGAAAYGRRLGRYRIYMVNHEVGHLLGRGHASCPAAGAPAPVMMQQTKGVAPCRPNPWPLLWER
jgi:Protein of unknown function (DUF3152)